jgi:hypothetical protein
MASELSSMHNNLNPPIWLALIVYSPNAVELILRLIRSNALGSNLLDAGLNLCQDVGYPDWTDVFVVFFFSPPMQMPG